MLGNIPAIVRVLIVFTLILIAIRKKISLGNSFLLGAILLGVMFSVKPMSMVQSAFASVTHPKMLSLAITILLILVFSQSMEIAGQMQRLLENFQNLIKKPRFNLVVFPALIGLLPMPGGAVFSAPMVKTLGAHLKLSGDKFSYINYWFRHIWEYWWPLYPGVLLTTTLANLNLWIFVLFLVPVSIISVVAGYWKLRSFGDFSLHTRNNQAKHHHPPIAPFVKELSPIIIVIGLGLSMGALFSFVFQSYGFLVPIAKELGLIVALLIAVFWVWYKNGLSASQRWHVLSSRYLLSMGYMVATIFVFKGILEDSHAVEAISNELLHWHIPIMPITVVLPFLVGVVSGLTIAFVGTTFPILIVLTQSYGGQQFMLGYMMLGLASGFVGVLVSPLHLCFLLSNQYFGTTLGAVYRHLWLPCASILIFSSTYFWIVHWLNPLS